MKEYLCICFTLQSYDYIYVCFCIYETNKANYDTEWKNLDRKTIVEVSFIVTFDTSGKKWEDSHLVEKYQSDSYRGDIAQDEHDEGYVFRAKFAVVWKFFGQNAAVEVPTGKDADEHSCHGEEYIARDVVEEIEYRHAEYQNIL